MNKTTNSSTKRERECTAYFLLPRRETVTRIGIGGALRLLSFRSRAACGRNVHLWVTRILCSQAVFAPGLFVKLNLLESKARERERDGAS
ncbi:hypothetical protein CIPAW_06G103400 [Carya illinoinensis]|uniref:Uncharacterized protein n=1 Tax=Carya illinoinensis TaxID=32201 RepID=A0A8T1QAJ7_CARIL|nr:hypothetical protein CIPAW_06G103400 [Carya illinoinensis]